MIIVRLIDLDPKIKGMVREDADGDYNIYINSRLNVEQQREVCQHELLHIRQKHFDSGPVAMAEYEVEVIKKTPPALPTPEGISI